MTPPDSIQLFYHCACMGAWRAVVAEQASLFSQVGLVPCVGVLGNHRQIALIRQRWPVVYANDRFDDFETPTLQELWLWCREHPTAAVIYAHTKGVSRPGHNADHRRAWRWLMNHWIISRWRENWRLLADRDIVGVNFRTPRNGAEWPHFSGNFFAARADWIARLESPWRHRASRDGNICGDLWQRMHAEMWPMSGGACRYESLGCQDAELWRGPAVFELLAQVRGSQPCAPTPA